MFSLLFCLAPFFRDIFPTGDKYPVGRKRAKPFAGGFVREIGTSLSG
jgi:hypothetical protein